MRKQIWRWGKITLGALCLVLGVIGILLPIVPQIPFLLAGLTLLSSESPRAKAWLHYIQERTGWRKRVTS